MKSGWLLEKLNNPRQAGVESRGVTHPKLCSHLSCHELSEARRERERGHEQGDEGGIHQASDGKGRAAGSLISVSVTSLCARLSLVVRMEAVLTGVSQLTLTLTLTNQVNP